jgi:hypothetical protein
MNTPAQAVQKDDSQAIAVTFILLFACLFLYLLVFIVPDTPRCASGDQAIYLEHATRMLQGDVSTGTSAISRLPVPN